MSRGALTIPKFFLTMTNTVVDRESYSAFIRIVFYDGRFPFLHLLFHNDNDMTPMTHNRNTLLHLLDVSILNKCHHNIYIASASLLHLCKRASGIIITAVTTLRLFNHVSVPLPLQNIFSLNLEKKQTHRIQQFLASILACRTILNLRALGHGGLSEPLPVSARPI